MRGLELLVAAAIVGTVADAPAPRHTGPLAVDFHVHAFPLSWNGLAPWDLVLEARRQGLDAVAIAGHNHIWAGQVGRWFSRMVGGPTVIVSEEVHPPRGHVIALGIQRTVDWNQSTEAIIDDIHRQGGLAIAAHPTRSSWGRWSDAAVKKLDGSEVEQPITILRADARREMYEFHERAGGAAIGSSDYHGLGPLGLTRTCVQARDNSEAAILEAVRAGRAWPGTCGAPPPGGVLPRFSAIAGILGLAIIVLRPSWPGRSERRRS
jgi:hypothetical protein